MPRGAWSRRQPGLAAMLRLKNEEEWIEPSLLSIVDWFDEIIVTLQNSTDRTEEIIRRMDLPTVRMFPYPFDSFPNGPGHDLYPADSVHSRAYYYNWSLAKTTREWVCKWDGDMVAMDWLGAEVRRRLESHDALVIHGLNLAGEGATHQARRALTAPEPRFFRVRRSTYYRPGPHCEVLSLPRDRRSRSRLRVFRIDEPAFLHFKWAKSFASASKAWPLNWQSVPFFRELAAQGAPTRLYEGEVPSVLTLPRAPGAAAPPASLPERLHLFVTCLHHSGAELLLGALGRCHNALALGSEHPAAQPQDPSRPCIHLAVSHTDVAHTAKLERENRPAYFLILVRDPYAVAERLRRHRGYSLARCAEYWIRSTERQMENLCARQRTAWFSYEELRRDPRTAEGKIRGVVPGLDDLDLGRDAECPESTLGTTAGQTRAAARHSALTARDIRFLSRRLRPHLDLLRFWGYELL